MNLDTTVDGIWRVYLTFISLYAVVGMHFTIKNTDEGGEQMRTRIEGLVQLKTGDALKGVVSRRFGSRFLRVDNATALAAADPGNPVKMDGVVWVPRANVSFIQEITTVKVAA